MCRTAQTDARDSRKIVAETVMMNRHVRTVSVAITLLLSISGMACLHAARGARVNNERKIAGSLNARQHGYEQAYRDGADRGRQDRDRTNPAYDLDSADYRSGDRGYIESMGDKGQYQQGYREGYRVGYDDAYKGRTGPRGTASPRD
jgi:hypothetical protein